MKKDLFYFAGKRLICFSETGFFLHCYKHNFFGGWLLDRVCVSDMSWVMRDVIHESPSINDFVIESFADDIVDNHGHVHDVTVKVSDQPRVFVVLWLVAWKNVKQGMKTLQAMAEHRFSIVFNYQWFKLIQLSGKWKQWQRQPRPFLQKKTFFLIKEKRKMDNYTA